MKASDMTNNILADECESVAESMEKYGGKGCGAKLREAAARLRKKTQMNFEVAFREDEEIIANLRARMKVAEDALEDSLNYSNSEELRKAQRKAKNALAASREEGGES